MRYERNKEIKQMKIMQMKKIAVSLAAILIVLSLACVDRACSSAVGMEEALIPRIVLVEEGVVKIKGFFGEIYL